MRATAKQPPARLLGRLFHEGSLEVGEDRALRARSDEWARQVLDVHVGTLPVPSFRTVDRDDGEDAIRAHVGAVAQSNHSGRERRAILCGIYGEHVFDSSTGCRSNSHNPGRQNRMVSSWTPASVLTLSE
jgi:hypothetical protein